jgi:hypothetical protein
MSKSQKNTTPPAGVMALKVRPLCPAASTLQIRTPWGPVESTRNDEDTRDPFEPEDPVFPSAAGRRVTGPIAADSTPPLSPRELFEMLMTPAAHPTRSSPVRATGFAAPAAANKPEVSADPGAFPPQADMVLSAMEAGEAKAPKNDRRAVGRRDYRVRAALRLFSDTAATPTWTLYTRDVHARGVGFITPHRLPLGYGGTIDLPDPDGGDAPLRVPCTILRCREAAPGWFEGSLYFNREQPRFNQV